MPNRSNAGVTVVIPDYNGLGMSHTTAESQQFMPGIEKVCREMGYRLIMVANGPNPDELVPTVLATRDRLAQAGFSSDHVILPAPAKYETGAVGATQAGYVQFLESDDDVVVKMDHAEHPSQWIPVMADMVKDRVWDTVFADLDFSNGKYVLGEKDRVANSCLAGICDGIRFKFHLTNAHGFQAYHKEGFLETYTLACKIHQDAGRMLNIVPRWGFDMSMILAAHLLDKKQQQLLIPAELDRNRDDSPDYEQKMNKVDSQAINWQAVALAYATARQKHRQKS